MAAKEFKVKKKIKKKEAAAEGETVTKKDKVKKKGDKSSARQDEEKVKKKKKEKASDSGDLATDLAAFMKKLAPQAEEAGEQWATALEMSIAAASQRANEAAAKGSAQPEDQPAEILDSDNFLRKERKKKKKEARQKEEAAEEKKVPVHQQSKGGEGSRDGGKKVWLGNLPRTLEEQQLRADFAKFGEIDRLYFHKDQDGNCRGSAHVFYKQSSTTDKVLNLDNIEYEGRNIRVKRRSPRRGGGSSYQRMRQADNRKDAAETGEGGAADAPASSSAEKAHKRKADGEAEALVSKKQKRKA